MARQHRVKVKRRRVYSEDEIWALLGSAMIVLLCVVLLFLL